jgi:NH3-dependent NAD+ synthetase
MGYTNDKGEKIKGNDSIRLLLENFQARVRLPLPWAISQYLNLISVVTSNATEGRIGYSSAGGDSHMGAINLIGGISKATINNALQYFFHIGMHGLDPSRSVHNIIVQTPTAELRPLDKGAVAQTDESDLKITYADLEILEEVISNQRLSPQQAYNILKSRQDFAQKTSIDSLDGSLWRQYREFTVRNKIAKYCYLWGTAQFKRYMATLSPSTGSNPSQHVSRTPIIAEAFRTQVALMSLNVLYDENQYFKSYADRNGGLEKVQSLVARNMRNYTLNSLLAWADTKLFSDDIGTRTACLSDLQRTIDKLLQEETASLKQIMNATAELRSKIAGMEYRKRGHSAAFGVDTYEGRRLAPVR